MAETRKVIRTVTYRLLPGTKANARMLTSIAAARVTVWNVILKRFNEARKKAKEEGSPYPSYTWQSFYKQYTQLKREDGFTWLQDLPCEAVREVLKGLAQALADFFAKNKKGKGYPQKKKFDAKEASFRIPSGSVCMDETWLKIPCGKYIQMKRKNREEPHPYPGLKPVEVTVQKECKHWFAMAVYHVEEELPPSTGVEVGIDVNIGQSAAVFTNGEKEFAYFPDHDRKGDPNQKKLRGKVNRLKRKRAKQQKGSNRQKKTDARIREAERKCANKNLDAHHQFSRKIANRADKAHMEDIRTPNLVRSAQGTVEKPGKNVAQQRGRSRGIYRSGWGRQKRFTAYKCRNGANPVPPHYTSQTCRNCEHRDRKNRRTRNSFKCVVCGYTEHADLNAAAVILALGIGATARRGATHVGGPDDP